MARGENLPRFGVKAEDMKRRARLIRERNARREREAEQQRAEG